MLIFPASNTDKSVGPLKRNSAFTNVIQHGNCNQEILKEEKSSRHISHYLDRLPAAPIIHSIIKK